MNKFKLFDTFHNAVIHPICAILWLVGDVAQEIGKRSDSMGERLHNYGWSPENPITHAQVAHLARFNSQGGRANE